jgi:hypothetical protein
MLSLSLAAGDREQELVARRHRIVALAELGRIAELDVEIEAFARLADQPGHSYSRWVVPLLRGMRFLMDGRLQDSEQANEQAAALARRAQSDEGEQLVVAQLWAVRQEQGRVAELEELVRRLTEAHPDIAVWRLWLCRTLLETPRTAEAHALFRRLVANRFAELPRNSVWLSSAIIIVELCVALEQHREAEWLYDELAPSAALYAIDEWACVNYGSVARALAQLAAMLGRDEAARAHFEHALDADALTGAVLCLARTQLAYADYLARQSAAADHSRAADLRAAAEHTRRAAGLPAPV